MKIMNNTCDICGSNVSNSIYGTRCLKCNISIKSMVKPKFIIENEKKREELRHKFRDILRKNIRNY